MLDSPFIPAQILDCWEPADWYQLTDLLIDNPECPPGIAAATHRIANALDTDAYRIPVIALPEPAPAVYCPWEWAAETFRAFRWAVPKFVVHWLHRDWIPVQPPRFRTVFQTRATPWAAPQARELDWLLSGRVRLANWWRGLRLHYFLCLASDRPNGNARLATLLEPDESALVRDRFAALMYACAEGTS